MTDKKKNNKEDVPATVAGFYYQALLACRELTDLANSGETNTTRIGIERGADVKIIRRNGYDTSIEAKFYGENFTSNSSAITHSIYNFYKNSFDDLKLVFTTNVKIKDYKNIKFSLKKWDTIPDLEITEYRKYIRRCLLVESVKKYKPEKDEKGKLKPTPFETYILDNKKTDRIYKTKYYDDLLIDSSIKIQDYIDIKLKSDDEENAFIRKMVFNFSDELNVTKAKTIQELKEEILENINIVDRNKELILNVLIDSFLQTTVEPTDFEDQSLKKESISIEEYNRICENAEESDLKFLNQSKISEFIEKINNDESDFVTALKIDYEEEIEPKRKEIIKNYSDFRHSILKEIGNSGNIDALKAKYSIKKHETVFQFMKLIRYFAIIKTFNGGNCLLNSNDHQKYQNIEIDNVDYCYKHSGIIESFKVFQHHFISETYDNVDSISYPIIADVNYRSESQRPCNSSHISNLPTDIGDIFRTEQLATKYRNMDYRCTYCISHVGSNNDIVTLLKKFFRRETEKNIENV